MYVVDVLENYA